MQFNFPFSKFVSKNLLHFKLSKLFSKMTKEKTKRCSYGMGWVHKIAIIKISKNFKSKTKRICVSNTSVSPTPYYWTLSFQFTKSFWISNATHLLRPFPFYNLQTFLTPLLDWTLTQLGTWDCYRRRKCFVVKISI